jgi:hypothetical protein
MHVGLRQALCAPYSVLGYRSPVPFAKFQMASITSTLMSSRSKKKETRCVCLSEAKPHTHRKCGTEVSSSVPHFLQVGLLLSPIMCRCLLKVLCPVSRPIATLDCVPLKDSNRAPVARSGTEINSPACLCVLQGQRHNTKSIPEPLSVYYKDNTTIPHAVCPSSVSSFF